LYVFSDHDKFTKVKPHTEEALGSLQINKYGDLVERDLKYHHSSTWYKKLLSSDFIYYNWNKLSLNYIQASENVLLVWSYPFYFSC